MNRSEETSPTRMLLRLAGFVLLASAASALYLGFLSPMNRARHDFADRAGGAILLAAFFGAPGAYLMYLAGKPKQNRDNGSSDSN